MPSGARRRPRARRVVQRAPRRRPRASGTARRAPDEWGTAMVGVCGQLDETLRDEPLDRRMHVLARQAQPPGVSLLSKPARTANKSPQIPRCYNCGRKPVASELEAIRPQDAWRFLKGQGN